MIKINPGVKSSKDKTFTSIYWDKDLHDAVKAMADHYSLSIGALVKQWLIDDEKGGA